MANGTIQLLVCLDFSILLTPGHTAQAKSTDLNIRVT